MMIRRGSTRVALIMFGLVFKFPTLKQRIRRSNMFRYFRGVSANVTEFTNYLGCEKASFLAPVFSLGFVNIQKYQGEEKPSWKEMETILQNLSKEAQETVRTMDMHPFAPSNFRRVNNKLLMIDFGDSFATNAPLSYFLIEYHKEFEKALSVTTVTK